MSDVTIEINGRAYQIACEDGQEEHLQRLAEFLEKRLQDVASTVGQVGQERLLVMAGLLIADELSDSLAEIDEARANPNPETVRHLQDEASEKAEAKAAHIFELLADRIETIAGAILPLGSCPCRDLGLGIWHPPGNPGPRGSTSSDGQCGSAHNSSDLRLV